MTNIDEAERRAMGVAQIIAVGLFLLFAFSLSQKGAENHQIYLSTSFAGRVDTIYKYNKGWPVVSLSGRRITIHEGSHGFTTYLSVGDSVSKAAGSEDLRTYRLVYGQSGHTVEVSVWSDDPDNKLGQWGLVDRYRIEDSTMVR